MTDKRYAVLFDADNNNKEYVKFAMDEMSNEGIVTYKRMYGDWTSQNLQQLKELILEYSITPMQQYSYTSGKNSTDSAMIIDAMDILYTGTVDGFCIVSSDSDFTKLASRLREAGMNVIGMGRKQTPKAFVAACNKFKYVDNYENINSTNNAGVKQKAQNESTTDRTELENAIKRIIEENADDDGWVLASTIGDILQKRYSDFDPRNYGYKKLAELLVDFGFEIKKIKDGKSKNAGGSIVFVKIK